MDVFLGGERLPPAAHERAIQLSVFFECIDAKATPSASPNSIEIERKICAK
jgi:hypothetical protein